MLKYWIWMAELPGLTNQARLALLRHFGTPENAYYADAGEILLTEGITKKQAEALEEKNLAAAGKILSDCRRLGLRILTFQDAEYPNRLRNIYDPPFLMYVRGHLPPVDEEPVIAVVGTRKCTPYGENCGEKLGYGLARGGAIVVSGLARGVDAAATRGALRGGGVPIGVLGCGLDVVYPPEHRYLYEDVAAAGALLSEYPPGTEPDKSHFPVRNRIMAGLAVGTVVVEAPLHSGALITGNTALEQGRDLFAVPGPIDAPASAGCNRILRDGGIIVTEPRDVLSWYAARFPDK
ncbi:DNA-processing protein DprA, partial [uncultured Oscillibacter sp.]